MFKREDFETKREDLVVEEAYYQSLNGLIMITEIIPADTEQHMGEELIAKAIELRGRVGREVKIYSGHYCRPARDEDYIELLLNM